MSRRTTCATWLMLALGMAGGSHAADATPDLSALTTAAETALRTQLRDPLLRPAPRPGAADTVTLDWPAAWRALVLAEAAQRPWLGSPTPTWAQWLPALNLGWHAIDELQVESGREDGLTVQARPGGSGSVPEWLLSAARQRLATDSVRARTAALPLYEPPAAVPAAPVAAAGWQRGADGRPNPAPKAMVWSGPAVRDRVTRSSTDAGITRLRIDAASADPVALLDWLRRRQLPVQISLDERDAPLPLAGLVPIRLDMAVPVWLVHPDGLLPARLTTLHLGPSCDGGGGHVELQWPGSAQPAVWALLFLPDADTAAAARVQRLPVSADRATSADQTGRLQVAWADQRLPTLTLTAKRFGEAWGTYAELPAPPRPVPQAGAAADEAPQPQRLSALGWPGCAPR